ncbi:MAG: class I SAM-dependent methyltransferase [bacterium]|nr:class I SAM-dependent methyltransferase [bacterium]
MSPREIKRRKIAVLLRYRKSKNSTRVKTDHRTIHSSGDGFKARIQEQLKTSRWYMPLLKICGPVIASRMYKKRIHTLLRKYSAKHTILNIGSGPDYYYGRKDIINVDIFPFREIDVIADAADLPFASNCADFVICKSLLEHVEDPSRVVREIHRVLKPGGTFLSFVPFIQPYHAAPSDYHRFTITGVKNMFASFRKSEVGIGSGPTSGMLWTGVEWLAIAFSFRSKTVHDMLFMLVMVVLSPLKLFDLLFAEYPNAETIASGFYVVAVK